MEALRIGNSVFSSTGHHPTIPRMSSTNTAAADMSCTKRQQAWPRFRPRPSSESWRTQGVVGDRP